MTRTIVAMLALSAFVAGGISAGAAWAQGASGTPIGTPVGSPGVLIGTQNGAAGTGDNAAANTSAAASSSGNVGGNVGPGIGPGTRGGVGPPIGGLDSNPYAEAPAQTRRALGLGPRSSQSAGARGGAKASRGTLN